MQCQTSNPFSRTHVETRSMSLAGGMPPDAFLWSHTGENSVWCRTKNSLGFLLSQRWVHTCVSVCLSVYLSVCLPVCLPASACLPGCVRVRVRVRVRVFVCLFVCACACACACARARARARARACACVYICNARVPSSLFITLCF